jgi:hypothetical protein
VRPWRRPLALLSFLLAFVAFVWAALLAAGHARDGTYSVSLAIGLALLAGGFVLER